MSYTAKNYMTPGGEELHIGGKLIFEGSGSFGGDLMEAQADSTATSVANLKEDFNGLLAKLRTAGLMASSD